jgi:ABC-type nitrate/sulfonate/bicarbonate transport system ATPase subunit
VGNAVAVHGLRKCFGSVEALRGVDLEVGEGEVVGLLGPNGAGKSTLVKILVGLVRASGGSPEVAGARAGSGAARTALGYLAELFRFPGWYSAEEVLELHQRLAGSTGGAAERKRLLELVALDEAAERRVDGMSKGIVCDRVAILRGGELVAAHDLARPRGIELETEEGTRLVEGATREDAPRLVSEAIAARRRVYGVRVLASTLEEVYLELVGGETR